MDVEVECDDGVNWKPLPLEGSAPEGTVRLGGASKKNSKYCRFRPMPLPCSSGANGLVLLLLLMAELAEEEEERGKGTETASLKVDDGNCALVVVAEEAEVVPAFEC
jgi:hypothetical protein